MHGSILSFPSLQRGRAIGAIIFDPVTQSRSDHQKLRLQCVQISSKKFVANLEINVGHPPTARSFLLPVKTFSCMDIVPSVDSLQSTAVFNIGRGLAKNLLYVTCHILHQKNNWSVSMQDVLDIF